MNRQRLALVGIVHDLAEAVVGDITPTEYSGGTLLSLHCSWLISASA